MYSNQIELENLRNRKQRPLKEKNVIKELSSYNTVCATASTKKSQQQQIFYILHKVSASDTLQGICVKYNVTKHDLKIGNSLACLFDVNDSLLLRKIIFIPFEKKKQCTGGSHINDHELVKIDRNCKDIDLFQLKKIVNEESSINDNVKNYESNNRETEFRIPVKFYRTKKIDNIKDKDSSILVKISHVVKANYKRRTKTNCFCKFPKLPLNYEQKYYEENAINSNYDKNNTYELLFPELILNCSNWIIKNLKYNYISFGNTTRDTNDNNSYNLYKFQKFMEITKSFRKFGNSSNFYYDLKNDNTKRREYISMISLN